MKVAIYSKNISQSLRNIGFVLLIVGMQLGMYLNLFLVNIGWNNILPPLALLAIANFNNISHLKFPLMTNNLMAVILFQLIVLLYIFLQGYTGNITIFTLFVTVSFIAFASISSRQFDFEGILKIGWPLAFVCCILGLYLTTTGATMVQAMTSKGDLEVDGLTLGGSGVTCIIFALFYKPRTKWIRYLVILSIIIGAATIIFSGKRSPLLVSFTICLFYMIRIKGLKFTTVTNTILLLTIGVIISMSVFSSDFNIIESLNNSITRTIDGIGDMLTGASKSGLSARMRYFAKLWAYDYINNHFSIINMFFGAGVMTRWLDIPILQSFLDMGLVGLLFYVTYIVVYPLIILFSKISRNPAVLFMCCYCLPSVVTIFNSGTPYGMARWIPIGLLLITVCAYKHRKRMNHKCDAYQ